MGCGNMSGREQAKNSIIKNIPKIDNDNVLRSVVFVIGDYLVSEEKEERANYITPILYLLVNNCDLDGLKRIYSFIKAVCD